MKLQAPERFAPVWDLGRGNAKPLTPLQTSTVYGPIYSRRLGCSLGINPLPASYKFCDFDCVYCQYGWTPSEGTGEKLKRAPELLSEIREAFAHHKKRATPVKCITIAGNGEPTLHPDFPALVQGLTFLRDEFFPGIKIGILTDSYQAHRPEIHKALLALDERYMKLDGGDAETLLKINRPRGNFSAKGGAASSKNSFQRLVESIASLPDIVVQSLFMQGSFDNTRPGDIEKWIEAIRVIHPREVQVYSLDRGPADPGLIKVSRARLQEIAAECEAKTGIHSVVFD